MTHLCKIKQSVYNYLGGGFLADTLPIIIALGFIFYGYDKLALMGGAADSLVRMFSIIMLRVMVAIVLFRVITRAFDRLTGIRYREWFHTLPPQAQAMAVSARVIGIAFIIGMCISI